MDALLSSREEVKEPSAEQGSSLRVGREPAHLSLMGISLAESIRKD